MNKTPENVPIEIGQVLIAIARATISSALGEPVSKASENFPWLQQQGACFVTLTKNQQLRGCIGTLEAYRPLLVDVKSNAYAAAFRDPRFSPLTAEELPHTSIEISLLSAMQAMEFSNEKDALAQLKPNIDGVVFEYGHYRSTFLPQVWEQLPDAEMFMARLKHKAGLQPEFWDKEVKLYRYTVDKWKEKDATKEVEALK
jgi:AmmeMemoRadiSam system protein A